jgi:hypothetical protein
VSSKGFWGAQSLRPYLRKDAEWSSSEPACLRSSRVHKEHQCAPINDNTIKQHHFGTTRP